MPTLNIPYEDLLSPDPIPLQGVGHIRSPLMKEMSPNGKCGWAIYSTYLYFLKAGPKQLQETFKLTIPEHSDIFSVIVEREDLRELYLGALSFFISEQIVYSDAHHCFLVYTTDASANPEDTFHLVGAIHKDNFNEVRSMILLRNYVSQKNADIEVKHSSKTSEELWNRAQEWMAKLEDMNSLEGQKAYCQ